jgi:hypothetical protein
MHRKDCLGAAPPLSRAILCHIASDWPAFSDARAAARVLSQKSRLANALSIAVNEVRVALAAALLCSDPPDASAESEPHEEAESRAEAVRRAGALRLYLHLRAITSDCTEPLAVEWKFSEPQISKVLQAFESVVGGDWLAPAYPAGSRTYVPTSARGGDLRAERPFVLRSHRTRLARRGCHGGVRHSGKGQLLA